MGFPQRAFSKAALVETGVSFHFCQKYYWSTPNFLTPEQVDLLLRRAQTVEEEGLLKKAAIGKGDHKKRDSEIRSDKIKWINDFSGSTGELIHSIFGGLQSLAKSELYLPAKRYECHFAKYEKGDLYKRHSDRHSFLPGRLITCVVYLSDLEEGSGGELILYDEELRPIKVVPKAGRIVVFDSAIEHEVKPSGKTRWSLTGWLREDLHPGLRV